MSAHKDLDYRGKVRGWIARVWWALQCRLNRNLPFSAAEESTSAYLRKGSSPSCSLLLGITTYGRPGECAALIDALRRSLSHAGLLETVFLVVVRDTSAHDYSSVHELLQAHFPQRFAFYESDRWRGKPGRYLTYQILFDQMRISGAKHALFFEDDVAFDEDLVERSLAMYEAIDDPEKAILYLSRFDDDNPNGQWVRFERRPCQNVAADETAWFDLHAFIAGRRFFEVLGWKLFRPHRWRWVGNEKRSSGVSEQMTLRLWGRASIFQVRETLAYHGKAPSLLNVKAREERALHNFPPLA